MKDNKTVFSISALLGITFYLIAVMCIVFGFLQHIDNINVSLRNIDASVNELTLALKKKGIK